MDKIKSFQWHSWEDNLRVTLGANSFWQAFEEVVLCARVITKDITIFLAQLNVSIVFPDTELLYLLSLVPVSLLERFQLLFL